MAFSVKLVEADDFTADINTTELTAFAAGYALEDWAPSEAVDSGEDVDEALTLAVKGTSAANLAGYLQTLADYARKVRNYAANPAERYAVWLRHNANGETAGRQALVKALRFQQGASVYGDVAATQYILSGYQMGLTRSPWWEDTAPANKAISAISLVGGIGDYTSSTPIGGDTAARIGEFYVTIGGGKTIYKLWAGFRSNRNGDRSKFQSFWSLRKATSFYYDTDGGITHADATAKDGYKAVCTFATHPDLHARLMILARNVTSGMDYAEQRGQYTVLLRAKLSASGTVRARLEEGYYTGDFPKKQQRVTITSTDWQFYEVGTVQLPYYGAVKNRTDAQALYYAGFVIAAERIAGSCSLELDCLVLIPRDEGFIYVDRGSTISSDDSIIVQERADGRKVSFMVSEATGGVNSSGNLILSGGIPNSVGSLVMAGQRYSVSTLADTVNVNLACFQRWASLRGSE